MTGLPVRLRPFRRLLRHLAPALRRERWVIVGGVTALALEIVLRLLEPWPLKFVFDQIVPGAASTRWALPGGMAAMRPTVLLGLAALALVSATALRAGAAYLSTIGFALAGNRVLTTLRGDLFRRLQLLPLSFHSRARTGDLTVRLTSDVGLLQDVTVTALLPLAGDVAILLGMMGLMLVLNPGLALLALAPLPVLWLRMRGAGRKIRDASRVQRRREGAMAATAAETMSAIRTVQALSLHDAFARVFTKDNTRSLDQGVKAKRLSAGLERSVDVVIALSSALVLWQGGRLVLQSAMTPGDLIVFLAYLKSAFKPMQSFAKYTGRLAKAGASAERVLDILELESDVRDDPSARPAPRLRGVLSFRDVRFSYEPGSPVLDGFGLDVSPGELVALVGPSGCGKSTVANMVLRLFDPESGQVTIDGRNIRAFTLESLRANISVVLQDTILFAGTVRENLTLGAPATSDDELWRVLTLARADEFVRRLPGGLDAVVRERGATLSSGQRQRLALARAALRDTPLLILDEPTTGLDAENERLVAETIGELAAGRTTLLISHAPLLIARATRVVDLATGAARAVAS